MKKFYMLMVALLCGAAAMAQDECKVYLNPIKVDKGVTEASLEICLKTPTALNIKGVSTRVQLPDGVSYVLKKNKPQIVKNDDRDNGHMTSVDDCGDGIWQFSMACADPFWYEPDETEIDGPIFSIPLAISDEVAAVDGTYPIKLFMISVADGDNVSKTLDGTFPTEYEDAAGLTVGAGTGIIGINADDTNAPIYNVAGQRVSKAQKGIFIQNGKKVAVK